MGRPMMEWPKGRIYYEEKLRDGCDWQVIADRHGANPRTVISEANRYANTRGLPPIGHVIATAGQEAYECRRDSGLSWREVGQIVGCNGPAAVARHYALKNGLPWPLGAR